jgi:arabinogalactan endo-1,4-beta-galactosidase
MRVLLLLFGCFSWTLIACQKDPNQVPTPAPTPTAYELEQFVMGVDLSYVNQIEDNGGLYSDGALKDPFQIFKHRGANAVRVRLWHHPQWYASIKDGQLYSHLADVEKTIARAKNAGLAVNLDFHYSDTWADPGHQSTPAAWSGLPLAALKDSVYQYTIQTLQYLAAKNLVPEMVQIGNETNQGMLFPAGKVVNGNYGNFSELLQSGIRAVRDFSTQSVIQPKIILHVAQYKNAKGFVQGITSKGVQDFDIIGISHYEKWSEGYSFPQITNITRELINQYGKEVMIVETACPWTSQNADTYSNIISGLEPFAGYPATKQGQSDYMKALTQALITGGGSGLMYWEPAWITSSMQDLWGTGSSWENNALFDFTGKALPAMDYFTYPYDFK